MSLPRLQKRMIMLAALALAASAASGCAQEPPPTPRPIIRVGVGMTLAQIRSGSTYPFKDGPLTLTPSPGIKVEMPKVGTYHDWVITEPYDLILVCDGHELKRDDVGGDHYLTAISTADDPAAHVERMSITFQNHTLTLDEALAEAKKLNDWFVQAGFHLQQKPDGLPKFMVLNQESGAPKYHKTITNYDELRAAFLDNNARIIGVSAFDLVTKDENVILNVIDGFRSFSGTESYDAYESKFVKNKQWYYLQLQLSTYPDFKYEPRIRTLLKQARERSQAH